MDFIEITLRYKGHCFFCKSKMIPGEIGLWTRGVGIKHKKCASGNGQKKIHYENYNKHSDNFYRMKAWRDSLDN